MVYDDLLAGSCVEYDSVMKLWLLAVGLTVEWKVENCTEGINASEIFIGQ